MDKYKIGNTAPPTIAIFIIASFAAINSAGIMPALPSIAQYFKISEPEVQNVISYFIFGYLAGQIFYGPLTKAFGNKPTLRIGIAICLIGNICCYMSYYINDFTIQKTC